MHGAVADLRKDGLLLPAALVPCHSSCWSGHDARIVMIALSRHQLGKLFCFMGLLLPLCIAVDTVAVSPPWVVPS